MRQKVIIIISAVIILLVIIGLALFFIGQNTSSTNSVATSSNPFGTAGNTSPSNTSTGYTNSSTLVVTLKNGSNVTVPDFTKQNQPSTANAESGYQVAGSNTGDYQILYFPQNSGFLVSLFVEPLGSTRLEAEAALRKQLGLTDTQLCALTIEVRTTVDVNQTYAGRDLGLSFCPGAVPLP
jgi:hypothetical protein